MRLDPIGPRPRPDDAAAVEPISPPASGQVWVGTGPRGQDAGWYSRRWLPLTVQFYDALIDQLWIAPGDRLLDVGCGPGALVAEVAPLVGPFGRVLGLDWSTSMLQAGTRLTRRHDLHNVAFIQGDMGALPIGTGSQDLVTCSLGLREIDDPTPVLREMVRVLCPGGRLGLIVQGAAARSPGTGLLMHVLTQHGSASGYEEGFQAHAPAEVAAWLQAAGLARVGTRVVTRDLRRMDFADFWADVYAGRMPGTPQYRALPAQAQAAIRAEIQETILVYRDGTRLRLPVEAIVAWGHYEGSR